MWLYIGIVLFFVVWGIKEVLMEREEYDFKGLIKEILGCSVLTFIVGVMVAFCIFIVGSMIASGVCEVEDYKYYEKPIYSLQDNFSTKGRFGLGRGYIDSDLKYYFLANTKYGYKVEYVSSRNTYLQKDGKEKIDFYEKRFKNEVVESMFQYGGTDKDFYILHVPEDTIEFDYRVDLN